MNRSKEILQSGIARMHARQRAAGIAPVVIEAITASDSAVISWDVYASELSDGSPVFDVIGTSDEARVTFHCVDQAAAERLVEALNSDGISGAIAEASS